MSSAIIAQEAKIATDVVIGEFVVIEAGVEIASGCTIGHHAVIHQGTVIGAATVISDHAVLGKKPQLAKTSTASCGELEPLVIGSDCQIGAGAIIYAGTRIGETSVVADLATVRENCQLGVGVVVGRGVAIENNTTIGDYTKIQTNAYITANMRIEERVFVAPMVTTTNDNYMGRTEKRFALKKGPTIKRGARIGGNAILLPGVTINEESFVAAGAIVTKDTPAHQVVRGTPAKPVRPVPSEELLTQ